MVYKKRIFGKLQNLTPFHDKATVQFKLCDKVEDGGKVSYILAQPEENIIISCRMKPTSEIQILGDEIKRNYFLDVICVIDLTDTNRISRTAVRKSLSGINTTWNIDLMNKQDILLEDFVTLVLKVEKEPDDMGGFFKTDKPINKKPQIPDDQPKKGIEMDIKLEEKIPIKANEIQQYWDIKTKKFRKEKYLKSYIVLSEPQIKSVLNVIESEDGGLGYFKQRIEKVILILKNAKYFKNKEENSIKMEDFLTLIGDLFISSINDLEKYNPLYSINKEAV